MTEWKPISELFDYEKGTLQSSKCTPGKYTFITASAEWKTHNSFTHDCEALIFAMAASGSLGRTHYFNGKFISSDLCFILTPKKGLRLDLTFYHRLFNFFRVDIVKKTATGTSKLAINRTNFGEYKLPYFDYEHQLKFKDKMESINPVAEEFLSGIDNQLSFLRQLRQQVLQEAIEGKLTVEWRKKHPELVSCENHASKLLEKIKAEKERLIKEGKIRNETSIPLVPDVARQFILPNGWTWCRLGDICFKITDGFHNTPPKIKEGVPYISATHVKEGKIYWEDCYLVSEKYHKEMWNKTYPKKGEILIVNIGAGCGASAIIDVDYEFSFKNTAILKFNQQLILNRYLLYYLNFVKELNYIELTQGGLQPFLSLKILNNIFIPLPPRAEQQTVVERIDKLMSMIDKLEKQVIARKEQSELLMQSVLREAFSN